MGFGWVGGEGGVSQSTYSTVVADPGARCVGSAVSDLLEGGAEFLVELVALRLGGFGVAIGLVMGVLVLLARERQDARDAAHDE